MTILYDEDRKCVGEILAEARARVGEDYDEVLEHELVCYCATLRPPPPTPTPIPSKAIPMLTPDDVFMQTGRGIAVSFCPKRDGIHQLNVGDHVMVLCTAHAIQKRKDRDKLGDINAVYRVNGLANMSSFTRYVTDHDKGAIATLTKVGVNVGDYENTL